MNLSIKLSSFNRVFDEKGTLTIGELDIPIKITQTGNKNKLLFDILYDYITVRVRHNSHGNRLSASVKTKLPIKHSLTLGKSYTYNGIKYNSIKDNDTRLCARIDGILCSVVLENNNRITMIPDKFLK
jgi:hypothetical protein